MSELAAKPFTWYKYTSTRKTNVKYNEYTKVGKKLVKNLYVLPFDKDRIFGIAPSLPANAAEGAVTIVDFEMKTYPYYITQADADRLVANSKPYRKTTVKPVSNAVIEKDKNNLDDYVWHRFDEPKAIVTSATGVKIGTIKRNEVFGALVYKDQTKGGYFIADSVTDKGFDDKPVKMKGQVLADLIMKSTPLSKRPSTKKISNW